MNRVASWLQIVRLGLVQASIGAMVVFATSTLNRVMVVELAFPAIVPGALVALHYAVQILRPRWGFGADRGGRMTPWVVGGVAVLAAGCIAAALATAWMATAPLAGALAAIVAFVMIGIGVGAAGTSLLLLLAKQAGERRRAAAATIVWMMMIAGFIVTAAVVGHMLAPFTIANLIRASATIAGAGVLLTVLAVWRIETSVLPPAMAPTQPPQVTFGDALRTVWAEPEARRFTLFVFFSMLAYSAQELILEPFAGSVFALAPAESAKLAGVQHTGLLVGMILVAVLGSAVGGPRLGSMRMWTISGCLASAAAVLALAGTGVMAGSAGLATLRACVFALGVANGAFSIAAIAAMMQLAGSGASGRDGVRMGLWGAAQALAFACGGVTGTGASDLARHAFGSAQLSYPATFAGEAILFCVAASLAARAFPRTTTRPAIEVASHADTSRFASDTSRWAV